jgi:hypothetical protein
MSTQSIKAAPVTNPPVERLLRQVQRRLAVRQVAWRSFLVLLVLAGLYGVLLLTGRLTGLFPDWFTPWSVTAVPALSLLIGFLLPGRPDRADAAHAIDRHQRTKDLFLTWTMLEDSPSEYSGLVDRDAARAAGSVEPKQAVPYQWEHPVLVSAGAVAVLLLGAFFVPTLDPFGQVAVAKEAEEARQLLEQTKTATELRQAELAQKDVDRENSEEVEQAIEALKAGLREMKKGERRQNQQKLNLHQKEIGERYRKLSQGELKSLFDRKSVDQNLGMLHDQELFRKWQKELQQGSSESLKSEIEQIQNDLERLSKTTDPVEKSELQRQLQKKMKELSDFADKRAGSEALNAAVERAMQQLETARKEGLSQEAMEALRESLDVAKQEMELLAQSARDMQSLEEALEVISMCKQCNAKDQLDGEMFPGEMTLEDYAEMYAQLMAMYDGEGGDGDGTGGRGIGGGGIVDEDDSGESSFVDEKSRSAIQKGKILLSLKSKGLSDTGDIQDAEYQKIVGEIRQSLEEVIDQEEIPPGYVEGIKKYFDTLDRTEP